MLKKRVLKAMIKDNLVFLAEFNSIKTGNGTKPRNIVTVLKYIKSFDFFDSIKDWCIFAILDIWFSVTSSSF